VGLGFWASKALLSAVELDLFTVLAAEPLDADILRRRLGVDERGARDFFDALVALGMLERHGGRYRNTPETDHYLDRNKPSYVGGLLHHANTSLYEIWGSLTDALRTGRPCSRYGAADEPFGAAYADPEFLSGFTQAMAGASIPIANVLARRFPWSDHRHFIDIGAAQGGALVEIVRAHPHLTGGGFDLPVVQLLRARANCRSRGIRDPQHRRGAFAGEKRNIEANAPVSRQPLPGNARKPQGDIGEEHYEGQRNQLQPHPRPA
jgi:Dimerisation domain/O-methyltransferase domain